MAEKLKAESVVTQKPIVVDWGTSNWANINASQAFSTYVGNNTFSTFTNQANWSSLGSAADKAADALTDVAAEALKKKKDRSYPSTPRLDRRAKRV